MSRERSSGPVAGEGGFALVAVLLVLALLLTVAGEFAQAMRVEGLTTIGFRNAVTARHLAEAAYERAVAEILPEALDHELDVGGLLAFRRVRLIAGQAPTREGLSLGPGRIGYRITDETARLNVNRIPPDVLRRLLDELGVERGTQDVIVDSLLDWRDANEEYRLGGAESDATSPWWQLHRLRMLVERDPARFAPAVRARWDELEAAFAHEAAGYERTEAPGAVLEAFMERSLDAYLACAAGLVRDLSR